MGVSWSSGKEEDPPEVAGVTVQGVHACDLGVSLAFLKDFTAEHIEEVVRRRLTTGQVNKTLIKPVLKGAEQVKGPSYAELGYNLAKVNSHERPAFSKATVFVSQSWDNPFDDLVEALEAWMEESRANVDTTYFWIDIFCVPPGHAGWGMPESWWSDRYTKSIGSIGTTVVVAEPWYSPSTFVGPWCIWQLYCTTVTGARLHLAMGPEQRSAFMRRLTRSFEEVRSALSEVKVGLDDQDAAGDERHHIIDEIQRVVSLEKLNEVLQTRLRHWLVQCAKDELQKVVMVHKGDLRADGRTGSSLLTPIGGILTSVVDRWRRMTPDELSLRDHVGRLLREMGNLGEAEAYFRKLRYDCEKRLGADSHFTLAVTNQLAVTLQVSRDPAKREEAGRLHRELLKRHEKLLGDTSPGALQSVSNLGVLLMKQWRAGAADVLREAKALSLRALEGRKHLFGMQDPRTLYTATTVALLISVSIPMKEASEAEIKVAERLHEEAAGGLMERLGAGHPLTLRASQHRAEHWLYRAECELDKELCLRALDELASILAKQTVKLGKEHDQTQETKELLHRARTLLLSLESQNCDGRLSLLQHKNMSQESRPWRECQPEIFQVLNTTEQYADCRRALREYGLTRLLEQLQELGFVNDQEHLTTGTKPFNVFARIGAGVMKQESMLADQLLIGKHQERFMVACNRAECDDNWESTDPAWLGKASMAKHHRFLITKDMHWKWFNVLVFGMLDNLRESIEFLEAMHEAAKMYVTTKEGWPQRVGFFFHVYALSSVNSLHLHIVDLENCGPTYHKMEHKNMNIEDVINVLKRELELQHEFDDLNVAPQGPGSAKLPRTRTPQLRHNSAGVPLA